MSARCSSGSAPPPAPTKTNPALTVNSSPLAWCRAVTFQRPSVVRSRSCTLVPVCTATPRLVAWSSSSRVSEPKSTSVPAVERVAATGWAGSRPSIISGTQVASSSWEVVSSSSPNSGDAVSAACRARM